MRAVLLLAATWCGARAQLLVPQQRPPPWPGILTDEASVAEDPFVPSEISRPSLCEPGAEQYAGYLDAGNGASYFFWMFGSRRSAEDPVVLWLSGGPGCSSMLALLTENGPCSVEGAGTKVNPHSWSERAHVIWLDQPVATGFSTGDAWQVTGERGVSGVAFGVVHFLKSFFQRFPRYKGLDLYVTGESYAGHYVPAVAEYLMRHNHEEGLGVRLRGIAIGNGWTDPEVQLQWYPQMAADGGRSEGGSYEGDPVLPEEVLRWMRSSLDYCVHLIRQCNGEEPGGSAGGERDAVCMRAYWECVNDQVQDYASTGRSIYDMRKPCVHPGLCYDFSPVTRFLNRPEVQRELGVNKTWATCNYFVFDQFQADQMKRYVGVLPSLLAAGVRVLIYAGDMDFICNWLGNKHWMMQLEWAHCGDFVAAPDEPFHVSGVEAGRVRSSHGLSFMQIYRAGHMVPHDQPEAALAMINAFLADELEPAAPASPASEPELWHIV